MFIKVPAHRIQHISGQPKITNNLQKLNCTSNTLFNELLDTE